MTTEKPLTGRGGAGRGQGRKPLSEGTVRYCFLMTQEQRDKLELLEGAHWLRAQIDAAKVPVKPPSDEQ